MPQPRFAFAADADPRPKQRARVTASGAFTPAATSDAEASLGWAFRQAYPGWSPNAANLWAVRITFREPVKARGAWVDVDNAVKLVLDALNELVWLDDRQVVLLSARMLRGAETPRIEVRGRAIGYLEDVPSKPVAKQQPMGRTDVRPRNPRRIYEALENVLGGAA